MAALSFFLNFLTDDGVEVEEEAPSNKFFTVGLLRQNSSNFSLERKYFESHEEVFIT